MRRGARGPTGDPATEPTPRPQRSVSLDAAPSPPPRRRAPGAEQPEPEPGGWFARFWETREQREQREAAAAGADTRHEGEGSFGNRPSLWREASSFSRSMSNSLVSKLKDPNELVCCFDRDEDYDYYESPLTKRGYYGYSFLIFGPHNPVRRMAIGLIEWPWFDRIVLSLIVVNCISLAMADPTCPGGCMHRNPAVDSTLTALENVFTTVFAAEMLVKMVALGVLIPQGSYLRNAWNIFDGLIVTLSIVAILPGSTVQNTSSVRAVRALRPLRTVTRVRGMRVLVKSLVTAMPQLGSVALLLFSFFVLYGIVGVQLFKGELRQRCFALPEGDASPAFTSAVRELGTLVGSVAEGAVEGSVAAAAAAGGATVFARLVSSEDVCGGDWLCGLDYGVFPPNNVPSFDKRPGKRQEARAQLVRGCVCYPVDQRYRPAVAPDSPDEAYRCEGWGPDGAALEDVGSVACCEWREAQPAGLPGNPNFGITTFDHFGFAFLSVFQSITLEGWTDIMYQASDGVGWPVAVPFFVSLVFLGAFFLINLTVAVLYDTFVTLAEKDRKDELSRLRREARTFRMQLDSTDMLITARKWAKYWRLQVDMRKHVPQPPCLRLPGCKPLVAACQRLLGAASFEYAIAGLIVLNTAAMATVKYEMTELHAYILECLNLTFTCIFALEMAVKLTGLGPVEYLRDRFNIFDAVIVVLSVVDVIFTYATLAALRVADPVAVAASPTSALLPSNLRVGFGVLRAFRLMRVFRLARSWRSLRDLMRTLLESLGSVVYLALILILFIFIFALLGMALFGGQFFFCDAWCFPPQDGLRESPASLPAGVEHASPANAPGCTCDFDELQPPRANFDDAGAAALTVFQILTGENWNEVLYSAVRAVGVATSLFFFLPLYLLGAYIILNLFVAILLSSFSKPHNHQQGASLKEMLQRATLSLTPPVGRLRTSLSTLSRGMSSSFSSAARRLSGQGPPPAPMEGEDAHRARTGRRSTTDDGGCLPRFSPPRNASSTDLAVSPRRRGPGRSPTHARPPPVPGAVADARAPPGEPAACKARGPQPAEDQRRGSGGSDGRRPSGGRAPPPGARGGAFLPSRSHKRDAARSDFAFLADMARTQADAEARVSAASRDAPSRGGPGHGGRAEASAASAPAGAASQASDRRTDNSDRSRGLCSGRTCADSAASSARSGWWRPRRSTKESKHDEDVSVTNAKNGPGHTLSSLGELERQQTLERQRRLNALANEQRERQAAAERLKVVNALTPTGTPTGGWTPSGRSRRMSFKDVGTLVVYSNRAKKFEGPAPLFGRIYELEQGRKEERHKELQAALKLEGYSFGVFPPDSPVRKAVNRVVTDPAFEGVVLLLILASAISLAVDSPVGYMTERAAFILMVLDICFAALFGAEMLLKWFAKGIHVYFKDRWNWLDAVIVLVSLVALAEAPLLQPLRVLRVIRPLRLVKHNEGLRTVVESLARALGPILNVTVVVSLFWLIFGILGVQLFMGQFYRCSIDALRSRDACIAGGGRWFKYAPGFDDIGEAVLTLFEISTLENWPSTMYAAMDATGIDMAPRRGASPANSLYFVVFILVGGFVIVNLFVGVVIDTFLQIKNEKKGSGLLNDDQRAWVRTQKLMSKLRVTMRPKRPAASPWRAACYDLVFHPWFEGAILTIIFANVALMAAQHYDAHPRTNAALVWTSMAFSAVFAAEMVVKLAGMGTRHYFAMNWNRLDFVLVVASAADVALIFVHRDDALPVNPLVLRAFRIFRMFRMVRLIKRTPRLRRLLRTAWISLPSLRNVAALLVLLFFVYAVLGVNLFGHIALNTVDGGLDRHANFQNFGRAFLVLLRMSTGEAWNSLMHSCRIYGPPECDPSLEPSTCGTRGVAIVYFTTFQLVCTFVMLNLVIGVILDNFSDLGQQEEEERQARIAEEAELKRVEREAASIASSAAALTPSRVGGKGAGGNVAEALTAVRAADSEAQKQIRRPPTQAELDAFVEEWSAFDDDASYVIDATNLVPLVMRLKAPLGTRQLQNARSEATKIVYQEIAVPDRNGKVHFAEVLYALAERSAGGIKINKEEAQRELEKTWERSHVLRDGKPRRIFRVPFGERGGAHRTSLSANLHPSGANQQVSDTLAALRLQSAIRGWFARKRRRAEESVGGARVVNQGAYSYNGEARRRGTWRGWLGSWGGGGDTSSGASSNAGARTQQRARSSAACSRTGA